MTLLFCLWQSFCLQTTFTYWFGNFLLPVIRYTCFYLTYFYLSIKKNTSQDRFKQNDLLQLSPPIIHLVEVIPVYADTAYTNLVPASLITYGGLLIHGWLFYQVFFQILTVAFYSFRHLPCTEIKKMKPVTTTVMIINISFTGIYE